MTDASNSDSSVASTWHGRLRSLGYSVFFPLLLVVAVVAPVTVAASTSVALFEAAEYTFLAVGIGYVVGLALLLR
ncbi:hypothetical protein [Salinigranum sp. GCM10025319]|uniref:hypothetical protein n=1 Tax=Salinigranum sp. GCM10025319 TaxID=3252687 RepID=UPI00360B1E1E